MFSLMKKNKVDIIIPNFNKGDFLDEAIKSVINQSYKNWKLFIIDDHSTDNSINILKKYTNNKKIKIFFLKKNKGPGYCRNLGILKSKSRFIAFLDSDDLWSKRRLYDQINFMIKNKFSFTYSDYVTFYQRGAEKKNIGKTNLTKKLNFEKFIKNSSINTSSMIIKRNLLGNIKFKNLAKLEDYIFKCEILQKKNVTAYKFNKPFVYYRVSKNNRSNSKLKNIYYLWKYNKNLNKLNFFENIESIFYISINSMKKYGLKLGV